MRNRLLPAFVYTREFATVLLLAMLWFSFKTLDAFPRPRDWTFVAAFLPLTVGIVWLEFQLLRPGKFLHDPPRRVEPPPRGAHLESAYLVIHLDISQAPPVATYAHIYSSSAQQLTGFGREAKVDLYRVQAATFEEALHEMEQIAPLYFPWVVPLMTRKR